MNPHRRPRPIGILSDDTDGRRTLRAFSLAGALSIGVIISVYASIQSVLALGVFADSIGVVSVSLWAELVTRVCVNLASTAVMGIGIVAFAPERRRGIPLVLAIVGIAATSAFVRAWLQVVTGVYSLAVPGHAAALLAEVLSSASLVVFAIVVGMLAADMWARARSLDQHRLAMQARSVQLLRDLQDEELRVRRELAETIHGSVQGTFVVLEATLRHLADQPVADQPAQLRTAAAQLASLREGELRSMSAQLYPVDLDRGMDAAIRTLTARMPAWVTVEDDAGDALAAVDPTLVHEARVLIVRVAEEAVSNALKHGAARRIRLRATQADGILEVTVENDGEPLPATPSLSGLARLGRRAEALDGALEITPGRVRGTVVTVRLPVGAGTPASRRPVGVHTA